MVCWSEGVEGESLLGEDERTEKAKPTGRVEGGWYEAPVLEAASPIVQEAGDGHYQNNDEVTRNTIVEALPRTQYLLYTLFPSVPLLAKGTFAGRDDKRRGGGGLWEGEIGRWGRGCGCGPPYLIVRPPVLRMQRRRGG